MSAQNASLAEFVLVRGQYPGILQTKVLTHFVTQVFGAGRPATSCRNPQVCSQLLAEGPNGRKGAEVAGQPEQSRAPAYTEESQRIRRAVHTDERCAGSQPEQCT